MKKSLNNQVFAFEVSVVGTEWSRIVNAHSRGKAKVDYWRDLRDPYPDIPFISIRCRKIGKPHTDPGFIRNAIYRGFPNARCGDRVRVGEDLGTLVGHNSSANFDVLFDADSPKYRGARLNVHPSECEIISAPVGVGSGSAAELGRNDSGLPENGGFGQLSSANFQEVHHV